MHRSAGCGKRVRVRIVSCTCSNTEIVCALGCGHLLVGVDDHSDHPVEVIAGLPRVGPDLGIDAERVRALAPDLVLASLTVPGHERVVESLERIGAKLFASEPICLADVYDDIRSIGDLLGVRDRAERLVLDMQAELVEPARPPTAPRILVEWWPKPVIVPGRDSWVSQLVACAGAKNPLAERPVKSTPISDEEAQSLDPDAVVIAWCGVPPAKYRPDVVYRRGAWQGITALKKRRVFAVPEAYLGRPGPRLVEGCRALRRIAAVCA